ncbi:MAG TPA: NAD-dependent deacylase [Planctomycetota bacterium]|nr:NAD-dependent deacylase [Planctomycetota bacterium]
MRMNTAGTAGSELPGPAGRAVRERLGTTGRITILTGAGVSAESGISTFRSAGGLWEQHSLEEVATPEGFERNPSLVLAFYNERRRKLLAVEPNPGHAALARLERSLGPRFTLITQNIDDLHERAGTQSVLHMHGELLKARCVGCAGVLEWRDDIRPQDTCPSCGAGLRPHVVWFGEIPFYLEEEIPRALDADVFIAVGTSGNVYPAAGMVHEARLRGKLTLEVNLEASANAHHFDLRVLGPAGSVLPELVSEIVSEG